MSDANKDQPSFDVSTTAGVVHVDADNAEEAAATAKGQVGGNLLSVKQAKAPKAEPAPDA